MNKIKLATLLLALSSSMFAKSIVIDNLNETKHINLSKSDINRFFFPAPIKTGSNRECYYSCYWGINKLCYIRI